MIKSMTGFGRCEIAEGTRKISVEMKSVNTDILRQVLRCLRSLMCLRQESGKC